VKNFKIILILHNIRSAHNVGSILRSSDGFGTAHVYFTGYTPYPAQEDDVRMPHVREKIERQIEKTALGAQKTVPWSHNENINKVLDDLRNKGFLVAALEQTSKATDLKKFHSEKNIALILGNEVDGVDKEILEAADIHLQIPMHGKKESFNVAIAGSIALYHIQSFN
jgi:23S rRNA (guanosine2251-2'-O)-methyltransferase